MGNWNHFRITQTIPEQHTRKKNEIKEMQKQPYWALKTAGSANVTVQNMFNMPNNMICSTNSTYRTAETLYTLETWFVSGI